MIIGNRHRLSAEIARQAQLSADIARGQMEVSTGKRILAPSDDAPAAARIAAIAATQADQKAWAANAESAAAQAAQIDTALAGVATAFDRASELMVAARSATTNAEGRRAIAMELRGLVTDIQTYRVETDSRGQPLFPDSDPLQIPVGPEVRIAATASRDEIFGTLATPAGSLDLAGILSAAADALELADDAARETASGQALDAIGQAVSHVAAVRGEQGVRAARIDLMRERLETADLRLEDERNGLEATDIPATIARINAKMLSLEAAQASFARINKSTLFDLLG
ncbi:flagellin-like protein [Sphingomonas oleivorans]|uniref:Flagellin n=1 Tax=Sphingomonas oleivorans TaxID=1735121 RepID=A0A2T5FUD9_9SPHN|nr:flagellin [Sphingomonas oleivorans]PTQ08139.1 flagellin-like protein [Sphingomonas oleivorans]